MQRCYLKVLGLLIGLFSSPIYGETLLELYQLAEQNDPQLKIAHSEYLAALEQKPQAKALLLPQVTLGAEATENWHTEDWLFGNNLENTTIGYNVSLSYALYRKERQIQLKQVDNQIQQTQANYDSAKQALIGRLSNRYFAVLAANDNLRYARSAKKAFKRQLDQAQQRFEVGLIAITDVQEAQAGYDLAVADEIQAQNDLDNAHEDLREITGSYHRVLAALNEDAPLLGPDPVDLEKWTQIALEQNPQILAAQYAIETARQEIEKQRAAHLPTVDLVGRHSYSDVLRGNKNPQGGLSTSNSIGVQFSYFLYEGGAISARIREAQQRHIQKLDQLEQQRRRVQLQTRQAFFNLLSNISRVKALKQALISTKTALEAVKTGFELGTRTSVDVVNAQRDLLQAQLNYSNARYNYVLNTLNLKQAAGLIQVEDLANLNQWLVQHRIELQEMTPEQEIEPLDASEPKELNSEEKEVKTEVPKVLEKSKTLDPEGIQ